MKIFEVKKEMGIGKAINYLIPHYLMLKTLDQPETSRACEIGYNGLRAWQDLMEMVENYKSLCDDDELDEVKPLLQIIELNYKKVVEE